MKKLLVFLCLALSMILFVCSCGGNNTDTSSNTESNTGSTVDTSTDTGSEGGSDVTTDTGINLNDGKYRAFVCDSEGNPIANVIVNFCEGTNCSFKVTGKDGYVELPSASYHVTGVSSAGATGYVFPAEVEIYFEEGSTLITITLEKE